MTRLSREQAAARRRLEIGRGHWGIDNGRHPVRDETPGEDRSRVRTGASRRVVAAWRHAAVHRLDGVAAASTAAATRRFAAHPDEALTLLFT